MEKIVKQSSETKIKKKPDGERENAYSEVFSER